MNQKGVGVILIVILVAATLLGGYFIYQNQNKPTPQPKITTQPSPSPADETANWKTYTNPEYGYSIKYPPEVELYNYNTTPSPEQLILHEIDLNLNRYFNRDDYTRIRITVWRKNPTPFYNNEIERITIANIPATREKSVDDPKLGYQDIISVSKNGYTISLALTVDPDKKESAVQLFNQIISTFKFTN